MSRSSPDPRLRAAVSTSARAAVLTSVRAAALTSARAGLAAFALAALVVGMANPIAAVDQTTILQPRTDQPITGPFTVLVEVDASEGELIDQVDAQLAGPSNRAWTLEADSPPDIEGRQRWSLDVDPLGGQVMRNGVHRLTARAVPTAGEPQPFEGFEITLRVPAIAPLLARPSPDDPRAVQLAWNPVDLPDFLGYRVQRRPDADGGEWEVVQRVADQAARSAVDTVPRAGAYRYRLVVLRSDGHDGRVLGFSDARGVRADPDGPGTFQPQPEPTPTVDDLDEPEPQPANPGGAPIGRPGQVAQADPGTPQTSTAQTPTIRPQIPRPAPAAPPVAPAAPAVVPFNDGIFQPELPIADTSTELTLNETETALRGGSIREGGTVAVLTEEPLDREVVVTGAFGLLLVVVAGHVRRFMAGGVRV